MRGAAWLTLAAVACCAGSGPGPPDPLRFEHALYNLTIPENSPPRTSARAPPDDPPLGVRLPAPGVRVRFRIRHGDKDKFFKAEDRTVGDFCFVSVRTRAGHADVLNRERRDHYRLDIRATATLPTGARLEADTSVELTVADVNDLSPLFYPTEYDVLVPEDLPQHSSVARVSAEDADLGLNGEIYYSFAEGTDQFAVHPTSGVVSLTRPLDYSERASHEVTVLAHDRASLLARGPDAPAARAQLVVRVARANLHAPEMRARRLPELVENSTAEVYAIVEVIDRDGGDHGRIASVEIVDGDPDGHFRVRPSATEGEWDVLVHALLDRERSPRGYNLTLRAEDAGKPPRSTYLSLPVQLADANDHAPVFSREIYEASIPETAPPRTPLVRLKVTDRDAGANARVYIEIVGGNEGGEFLVNPESGVLYTAVPLDAEQKALYTLTVSAVDQGNAGTRKQSSAKVKITVLDANDNDPVFEPTEMNITVRENEPPNVVVARVMARDADSGENAYISYSIANLQPVPFDVDHFSGAVRTTRLLDYESMRRDWVIRVRASDWGLPYRRQAELRLTVHLEDVNDNRPQFERTDCVGYVSRRLPVGSELATLSAIDFDAGDVVSYRLIGGNEDNCFMLDSSTGVLSLACELGDVPGDTRVLNVTATDGTHFADATSLTLHLGGGGGGGALECRDSGVARRLTEMIAAAERSNAPQDPSGEFPPPPSRYGENLHTPEFIDFPIEVKVNESVALGTTLVKLRARDRDLGYNGLLAFAISGGDDDSAFRVDPDTGELQVIGYLDREREDEYFLNVTVWDLGRPARAASRLLPVTVLDVNDNVPRFDKALASFRVTENALNGTTIFRPHATDRDAGEFARLTYSLEGAGSGEFCVDRDAGTLHVCAPLDRETRALYELSVRATDGGGLSGEALVRVAVDDVNDNAPQFALSGYSARVREDVPVGTVVALLDATDPDLGAGGRLLYSLPDQPSVDAVFTVDETSGTLRTAKSLDYEERQVYGVTVRATDGGQPALWAEATLIVEVLDVDENAHAPQFADSVLAGSVREDAARGASVLTCAARDADPPGRDSRLSYYVLGGTGMGYFSIDDAGVVRTLGPLDRETAPHYWLTVCAEDHALIPRHTCVQVYIEVLDVNDMAPWPERALYAASVPEHSGAGTPVARVTAHDADAPPHGNVSYRIVAGNPDGLFSIDQHTGEIVTTGRALDRETAALHALEVRCTDGELASAARVHVALQDLNDHAPVFTQRFYQLRAPVLAPSPSSSASSSQPHLALQDEAGAAGAAGGDEASAESELEEEEGEGGDVWERDDDEPPGGVYVGTVLALDGDAGANGSVVYTWRARAGRVLHVHARSGRVLAAAPLRIGASYELTVRACDGGAPARCGWARVSVRGVAPGGGAPPRLPPPGPLQVAELDAPGFLLALLQAHDPDGDALYYEIVDGDPRSEWQLGREDGSLVVARRLQWERHPLYHLNVSVSDGAHTVYTQINITVVNDVNEAGLSFSQEVYTVEVSEDARVGEPLLALQAGAGRVLYGIAGARAPASLPLFHLQELTGVLELARSLDRESSALHELTVWARDSAPRASRAYARVRVVVHDVDEHAPEWGRRLARARVPATAPPGALVTTLHATDRDLGEHARVLYSLAGGDAAGAFTVHPTLGEVRLARAPGPAAEYTLHVRAANPPPAARHNTLPLHVLVVEPDDAPPTFAESEVVCEVYENAPAGTLLAALEARSGSAVRYELHGGGGRGLFRINPAAGALVTAAPLDYETQNLYNLTVLATNMGGGCAEARVTVHVLDRNEFSPVLTAREYRGVVSESAAAGALVSAAGSPGEPLVLHAEDGDSPANRQRAYRLLEPVAAAAFRVDPTTGALLLAAALDYELQPRYEFTVKVLDMGSPRLPSDSVAKVIVDVLDVNDCAPQFEQATYSARVLLPTARDVLVVRLRARDADSPPSAIKYDVVEGDPEGAFAVRADGALLVAAEGAVPSEARLRVRASDGLLSSTARVLVTSGAPEPAGLAFTQPDYYGSAVENSTRPSTVAVLDVLGAALNEHVHFHILNPVDGFQIGVTSGAVTAGGVALDREARAHYTLLVEARSAGAAGGAAGGDERVAHARLHVAVTDVNDNCPVFVERPYTAAVRAGDPPGTLVTRVHAVDADDSDNGEVRYEMKRGHGELFRVDRRTGQLSLKQTLDAHAELYELVIAAFDGGTPACGAEAAVSVRVWRGGAAPAWQRAHYELSAREDTPPGAPLAAPLHAVSPLQRQLIYTLLQPELHPAVELHFDTAHDRGNSPCVLVCAAPLDHETAPLHELTLRATDGVTGAHADVAVTLHVLDVNDCAPEFERDTYRAAVSEAARVGHLVISVRALDNDTGVNGEVVYGVSGSWNASRPLFTVDEAGGVRVAAPLDRERAAAHHVLLTASDRGVPPAATTAHLFITVEDVNDNAPRMERSVVSGVVSSEAARGVAVAAVSAWDPDERDAGRLRYALASHDPHHTFAVNERTGVLSVANTRAWQHAAAPLSLNVSVSDGAHAAFARVKLTPAQANAHAPHFQHLLLEARALENQPPPLLLTTVKAYDEDAGEYGAVTYSIPSALLRDTFSIDAMSGALSARVPLDREARAEWLVPVCASDGGGLLRHTTVRVRVADLNDNAPAFPHREYRATVRADRAPGAPFLTLAAHDRDAGEHAALTYTLYEPQDADLSPDTRHLFRIDPASGALSLAANVTHMAGRAARVWVRATDGGGRAGEAPVSVYVLGEGESAPSFTAPPADLFLPEDAAPGTLIAQLDAAGGEARYRLAGGAWPPDMFAVDQRGRLVLAAALDREAAHQHIIGVIVEGAGSPAPASMAQVTLHVLDVNEHAPTFHSQPYVVLLAENAPPHSSVVQVMAEDPDAGANGEVRYSLAEESAGAPFALDPHTGWLVTAAPLDREAAPEHRLQLLAADGGAARRVARGSVVVRLRDYNDCPPRFARASYAAAVREDAPPGTVALRLEVTDPDLQAAPLSFYVADGDPTARFALRSTGELFVARALDRETAPRHDLVVLATDGKFSATADVHIDVLDANDNPPYCLRHRYYVSLREDSAVGSPVVTVAASDADEPQNARLRFYLSGDGVEHFAVHKEAGRVTVAAALDREARALYRLTAHAQDRDRAEWECVSELLVRLDDVNDNAPRFSAPRYSVTLPEDAELGTLVAKVHATDADLGANRLLRYTLLDEPGGAFDLAPDSGIVTLRAPLDRETAASHRLVVRAEDAGQPPLSATALVLLTVADVNDNPPEFEFARYAASVTELDAVGTDVLRVSATSKDTGVNADVFYSIVGGDERDDFLIDRSSGVISVARALDYERVREYALTVQAVDGGSPPLSDHAVVNITVLDCNDNAPSFSQESYGARVREDAAVGTRVLQPVALDADAGANGRVTYSITRGDRDGRFAIDADTGHVSLAAPLDRETTPAYVLEVRARDGGEPALSAQATVNVEVLDANDNAPRFAQNNYSCVVQEGRALGSAVLELRVTDADAAPNAAPYTFDLQAGNEAGAFRLEQDGVLRTATHFNHRIKDRYVMQIRVFDNGTPPLYSDAWVTVRVIEESQYPPVVTPLDVQVNSYLDEFPGGELGRVRASDRDAYDTLTWQLLPSAPHDLFAVEPRDGTLRAEPRLDPGEYRLNVTVSDGRFVSAAVVRISVVLVTEDMLARAVVVRFRQVTDVDFVLSHRKGFVRAVREAMECAPGDVVIISVQPSGDDVNELPRVRRQIAQDLDVLFSVRAAGGGWAPAETLRRRLHAHLERLEERTRLVVEELVRAACGGCVRGACGERAELAAGRVRTVASDVFSLVAPPHRLSAACACEPGYGGERCERVVSECARAECRPGARCEEAAAPPGYRCCAAGECRAPPPVAYLAGDGYALYRLSKGVVNGERLLEDELALTVRFRTRAPHGTLAYAAGRVDYLVLELVDGFVQLRMELGAGEVAARADALVSDGAWHVARLERRGGSARLTVDRHTALAQAPPPAAVLDTGDDHLYVGAALVRHAHANAQPQVSRGFRGCIGEVSLGGVPLPLEEGGAAGGAALARAVRLHLRPACPDLPPPAVCDSYPCLNGGTCVESAGLLAGGEAGDGWQCSCHARYGGARCELDRAPCAGRPCLHGGACTPAPEPPGYTCACAAPAAGPRCQHGRYCARGVCGHGGSCEEGAWGPSCRCRGYYGPLCQHDVDECAGEPCAEGATCLNEPGSFRCACPPGRTGTHCGNPLTSGAVLASEAAGGGWVALWQWARAAGWPLWAGGAALVAAAVLLALVPVLCRRGRAPPPAPHAGKEAPLNSLLPDKLPTKLSNLAAARRERPSSCADAALNNADTLRSYGSAGDELEGMPPDYLRNLNIDRDLLLDRKPWSEQMHLRTFTDTKIYNDLKGNKSTRPSSPASSVPSLSALRAARRVPGAALGGGAGGDLVGGYHWDCSDWCGGGGALPAITEVTAGERRDSTSPSSGRRPPHSAAPHLDLDTSSGLDDDDDRRFHFTDACAYSVHPDAYLPRAGDGEGEGTLRALRLREPDAASLITMFPEERSSLLGGGGAGRGGSASDVSARLCEIEDSDGEEGAPLACRHTDV